MRAFFPKDGATVEDPVTGSLNASLAQWLLERGPRDGALRRRARAPRSAAPAACTSRQDADGTIWVGGGTVTCISGQVELPG